MVDTGFKIDYYCISIIINQIIFMYAFRLITSGRYLISAKHYTCDIEKAKIWKFWNYDVALGYKQCLFEMGIETEILNLDKNRNVLKVDGKKN